MFYLLFDILDQSDNTNSNFELTSTPFLGIYFNYFFLEPRFSFYNSFVLY